MTKRVAFMNRTKVLLVAMTLASAAFADPHKVAPDLDDKERGKFSDVIIRFKSKLNPGHVQKIQGKGGTVKHTFASVNSVHANMSAARLAELSNDADVVYISPDRNLSATAVALDYGWMTVLGAAEPTATSLYDGTGVGVALID